MTGSQLNGLITFAIGIWMISLGLGRLRMPSNPRAGLFDPASTSFRRLMLVGGACNLVVSVIAIFGLA